jgi:hypothetical protein
MEHHCTSLAREPEALLDAVYGGVILFAGDRGGRVDREAVERLLAPRPRRKGLVPGERSVQVARDSPPDLRHLDAFVVELIHEMGRQIIAASALVAFQDHGSRPMARKQTVRISARSR